MGYKEERGDDISNPENQFVASSVKEDIAFGPENLGIAAKKLY